MGIEGPVSRTQYGDSALCCLGIGPARRFFIGLVEWRAFDRVSLLAVFVNCVMLAIEGPPSSPTVVFSPAVDEGFETGFSVLFTVEFALKCAALPCVPATLRPCCPASPSCSPSSLPSSAPCCPATLLPCSPAAGAPRSASAARRAALRPCYPAALLPCRRCAALGFCGKTGYLSSPWNVLDLVVVVSGWLPIVFPQVAG